MRVVFTGGVLCDETTLKRLVLVADEIGFIDRPSISFNRWGMVGTETPIRHLKTENIPIKFSTHAPPSGPVNELYSSYIAADFGNIRFINTFLEGLKTDKEFQSNFIQTEGIYGSESGHQILNSIINEPTLANSALDYSFDPNFAWKTDSEKGKQETLKVLLTEASVHITNALITAEDTNLVPVTNNIQNCLLSD